MHDIYKEKDKAENDILDLALWAWRALQLIVISLSLWRFYNMNPSKTLHSRLVLLQEEHPQE